MTTTLSTQDVAIDRDLADLASSFRFILDVTPVNLAEAKRQFLNGDSWTLHYRELEDDPEVTRSRLESIDVSAVDNAIVSSLFEERKRELELELDMLERRNSSDFLALSIERFGSVTSRLLDEADRLLAGVAPGGYDTFWTAEEFAARVETELDLYRAIDPDISVHTEVRADVGSVMVSDGNVLIPATARIPAERVEALIQHEIGTHVVTHINGSRQPVHMLSVGLAGYEETQEGLAVFTEYLVGGLTPNRIRALAARVLAVDCLVRGAEFSECHSALVDRGVSQASAFSITARVFRSGGLTKDALYLRGLMAIVAYVGSGRPLEPLWMGKMSLASLPLILELRDSGALEEPKLVPAFIARADASERIEKCTDETSVSDLLRSL